MTEFCHKFVTMAELIMVVYLSGFVGGMVAAGIAAIEYIIKLEQKHKQNANRDPRD